MTELTNNTNNNNIESLKCLNCQKDIKKKINNLNICLTCKTSYYNKFYNDVYVNKSYIVEKDDSPKDKKIRKKRSPNKNPMFKKSICQEVDYTMKNGEVIKINVKKLTKTCNMCHIEKEYTEFYPIKDNNKKYYLIPKCATCYCKLYNNNYKNFKKYMTDTVNNQGINNLNDDIEKVFTFNNNLVCVL